MTGKRSTDTDSSLPVRLGGEPAVSIPGPHFEWPKVNKRAEKAVLELLRNGDLSYFRMGGKLEEFEAAFKRQMGLDYAVSTHSGTAAIHAGWFGLNLPPGTEVVVPAYTHIGTAMPLFHLGLVPVLCDVDRASGNIDVGAIRGAITDRTGAIAVTHQFGLSAAMSEICAVAREYGLRILEDCSHAHGAFYKDKPVGTWGDVACFSLQSHKTVPVGEGGILLTSDPKVAERASLLGHYRQQREFSSDEFMPLLETGFGMKSRLHPLAAAIGVVALENLESICKQRTQNYALLSELLAAVPGIDVLKTPIDCNRGGYFRFVLQIDPTEFVGLSPEQVVELVQEEGALEARPGSLARCLHSYRMFQDDAFTLYPGEWKQGSDPLSNRPFYKLGDFPNAEEFSALSIQLPAFTEPDDELIRQYIAAFAKIQAHAGQLAAAGWPKG